MHPVLVLICQNSFAIHTLATNPNEEHLRVIIFSPHMSVWFAISWPGICWQNSSFRVSSTFFTWVAESNLYWTMKYQTPSSSLSPRPTTLISIHSTLKIKPTLMFASSNNDWVTCEHDNFWPSLKVPNRLLDLTNPFYFQFKKKTWP